MRADNDFLGILSVGMPTGNKPVRRSDLAVS